MNQKDKTIAKRIEQNKKLLLEQFKKSPIIEVTCQKVNISRATYYRWRAQDSDFCALADEALLDARQKINDLAESQLISAIKDGNMTSLIFWLKHNHKNYTTRVEVAPAKDDKLTPEQESAVNKALLLGGLIKEEKNGKENK